MDIQLKAMKMAVVGLVDRFKESRRQKKEQEEKRKAEIRAAHQAMLKADSDIWEEERKASRKAARLKSYKEDHHHSTRGFLHNERTLDTMEQLKRDLQETRNQVTGLNMKHEHLQARVIKEGEDDILSCPSGAFTIDSYCTGNYSDDNYPAPHIILAEPLASRRDWDAYDLRHSSIESIAAMMEAKMALARMNLDAPDEQKEEDLPAVGRRKPPRRSSTIRPRPRPPVPHNTR